MISPAIADPKRFCLAESDLPAAIAEAAKMMISSQNPSGGLLLEILMIYTSSDGGILLDGASLKPLRILGQGTPMLNKVWVETVPFVRIGNPLVSGSESDIGRELLLFPDSRSALLMLTGPANKGFPFILLNSQRFFWYTSSLIRFSETVAEIFRSFKNYD